MATGRRHNLLAGIRDVTQSVFNLPGGDALAVDFIVSMIVSNLWSPDADPLWGWLIGPPGSCKTELVRPLDGYEHVHYLSSLSGAALCSGYDPKGEGKDVSLLPLLDRKVLVIKDFTAVLGQHPQTLQQIFGDLRDAYDGSYGKHFGTVGGRNYRVKFGMLAAVTPVIDDLAMQQVILGERFLAFRICRGNLYNLDTRITYLNHVMGAMSKKSSWRTSLQVAWLNGLNHILKRLPEMVSISEAAKTTIIHSADLVSRFRCIPAVEQVYSAMPQFRDPEIASRLVNQLANLAMAHAAASDRDIITEDDLQLVRRVSIDTLPPVAWKTLIGLYRNSNICHDTIHIQQLSHDIRVPQKTLYLLLSQYETQNLVTSGTASQRQGYTAAHKAMWKLTDDTITQIKTAGLIRENPYCFEQ